MGPSALSWLLSDDDSVYLNRDDDGTPFECGPCPFGVPVSEGQTDLFDGAGATRYLCQLLDGREVAGENPVCTPSQWHARGRAELEQLRHGLIDFGWHKSSCAQVRWMQTRPRPVRRKPECDCGLADRLDEAYRALGMTPVRRT